MNIAELSESLYRTLSGYMSLFRSIWMISIIVGIILVILALILRKQLEHHKLPTVLIVIGALLSLSSLTQLVTSFL